MDFKRKVIELDLRIEEMRQERIQLINNCGDAFLDKDEDRRNYNAKKLDIIGYQQVKLQELKFSAQKYLKELEERGINTRDYMDGVVRSFIKEYQRIIE